MAAKISSLDIQLLRLATKRIVQLSYTLTPATAPLRTISWLKERQPNHLPALLTYDRFCQGQTTDRDPADAVASDPTHGHDLTAAVADLHQLITQIVADRTPIGNVDAAQLVLVGNSIGCALSRLYAHEYPGTVAALLLLDSNLANSDFVSIFPDPESPVSVETLRLGRGMMRKVFHPDVGNKEGLSRRNLPTLLPSSDSPKLQGVNGGGPYVTVIGHDYEAFAEESAKMGFPRAFLTQYVNPFWNEYNQGLVRITDAARGNGPLLAPGSGHFVQRDNPDFVVEELVNILGKVRI
ncbi:hypothetical protein BGW36DRAFT_398024 [Talaromyces proteolyticus]|uniref:AB hydrolase-1 domain-containing protein n=1 Tax=Talaromyces proteolyticus TaxID=1131652 RepID=A0AAD4KUW1_9EURO|nr:uncharacterized protein BGW36DRAFT_398024 [Talaromyces proteolyticus]KAH8696479.1 hypothetical protein BGW36DRAFT_398024 [Talaromyces proteolyticus]